jgi:hypothetical protein
MGMKNKNYKYQIISALSKRRRFYDTQVFIDNKNLGMQTYNTQRGSEKKVL